MDGFTVYNRMMRKNMPFLKKKNFIKKKKIVIYLNVYICIIKILDNSNTFQ